MASYGLSAQGDHVRSVVAEAKHLTVDRLKRVLRSENLQVSGIKSELQIRLIAHIEKCAQTGDFDRVNRIRNSIRGLPGSYSNSYPSPYSANTPTSSLSPQFASPVPRPAPPSTIAQHSMAPSYSSNRMMTFKQSPFYTIIKPLAPIQELKARESTRDTARVNLVLDLQTIEQMQRDSNYRVMVFCAAETFESRHVPQDISFPQHGELKCNSDDVKANLKGLKNKPGTTRPADITPFLRKKVNFPNSVELVYALTKNGSRISQKYYLVVNLVLKKPVDILLSELRRGKYVSKERVILEMKAKAQDPDIVATSSVMSLKDPVLMTRIKTPCRSTSCRHHECFDAEAYISLQEQAPTWTCPCCNRSAPWEHLVFDQYFDDILRNVSSDVDQVVVEPDGSWSVEASHTSQNSHTNEDDYDDDDDDYDLIMMPSGPGSAKEFTRTPSFAHSPPLSTVSSSTPQGNNKRKHTETIDLTGDDSEDEQPIRAPPKRSNTSSSTSFSFPNTQYQPSGLRPPYPYAMPPPNSSSNNFHTNGYYTG